MTQNVFDLLDRKIGRLKDEHVSKLLLILNESLKLVDVSRRSTVRDSLDYFARATVEALKQYAAGVRNEVLSLVEQSQIGLAEGSKASALGVVSKHFDDSLYANRFRIYEEAFDRHIRRFGASIDLAVFRSDLIKASHHVATTNFVRGFLASLADDLETLVLRVDQSAAVVATHKETSLEQANRLFNLEPNIFGIGINLNYVIGKLLRKKP